MPCGAAHGTRAATSLLPVPWITLPKSGMSTGTGHGYTFDECDHSSGGVIADLLLLTNSSRLHNLV